MHSTFFVFPFFFAPNHSAKLCNVLGLLQILALSKSQILQSILKQAQRSADLMKHKWIFLQTNLKWIRVKCMFVFCSNYRMWSYELYSFRLCSHKEEWHQRPIWWSYTNSLKNENNCVESNTCTSEITFQGTEKLQVNLSRSSDFWVIDQNI